MTHDFFCTQCKQNKTHETPEGGGGTGYAVDSKGNQICYACCAINDGKELDNLQPGQKVCHYWNGKHITNWPGTLCITPTSTTTGRHNIAGVRTDIYFTYNSKSFHAVQYGYNSQIAHIKTYSNI